MSTNENTSTNREDRLLPITDAKAPFDHADADVIIRSSDNVDFRVFKSFLSFSSPFFKDMFTLPQVPEGNNSDEIKGGLPVIAVTEESKILEMLLLLCYPGDAPVLDVIGDVKALLDVGIKYSIERAEKRARECLMLPKIIDESEPIRVFAIACHYRLQEEAKAAAMATFGGPLVDQIIEHDLDYITSTQLYRLMQYHKQCVLAAKKIATDFSWIKKPFCWFRCLDCRFMFTAIGACPGESVFLSRWWDAHMKRVAVAFVEGTWGKKMHKQLTEEAVREAAKCKGRCQQGIASAEMLEFSIHLEAEIQRAIVEIPLDLQF